MRQAAAKLTPFGVRVEAMRVERAWPPDELARRMGLSCDGVQRRLTGRIRVGLGELERFAAVFGVAREALTGRRGVEAAEASAGSDAPEGDATPDAPVEADMVRIVETLRSLPEGPAGQRMKLGFLALFEEIAVEVGERLPVEFHGLRRRVAAGEG